MPHLVVKTGANQQTVPLGNETITIGRSTTNTLPLEDNLASRAHAVIEKTIDGYQLRDLDSSNGTFCNGDRVEEVVLKQGDEVQIGAVRIFYHDAPAG